MVHDVFTMVVPIQAFCDVIFQCRQKAHLSRLHVLGWSQHGVKQSGEFHYRWDRSFVMFCYRDIKWIEPYGLWLGIVKYFVVEFHYEGLPQHIKTRESDVPSDNATANCFLCSSNLYPLPTKGNGAPSKPCSTFVSGFYPSSITSSTFVYVYLIQQKDLVRYYTVVCFYTCICKATSWMFMTSPRQGGNVSSAHGGNLCVCISCDTTCTWMLAPRNACFWYVQHVFH